MSLVARPIPRTHPDTQAALRAWLDHFSAAVRAVDFARGRQLFHDDVIAFGTRGRQLVGLDALERFQWRQIWPVTRDFQFHTCSIEAHARHGWALATWTSQGRSPDGRWFDRSGRATYVLARHRRQWLAVHSHHSMDPAATGLACP